MKILALGVMMPALALQACVAKPASEGSMASAAPSSCPVQTCRVLKEVTAAPGAIACKVNGVVGPAMYSPSALEVKAVASDLPTLRAIALHRRSPTLRFLYVGRRLLVFDARRGACGGGGIYNLINTPCLGYSPSDFQTPQRGIVAGDTSGCGITPPPWLPSPRVSPAPAA